MKLFPTRESSISLSRLERAGETEPPRFMFDKFRETTRPFEHLIPTHKHTELGFEEFQVLKTGSTKWKLFLRVIKASKSLRTELEAKVLTRKKIVRTMDHTIFSRLQRQDVMSL